jgi:GDP-D-mannose dehydratase
MLSKDLLINKQLAFMEKLEESGNMGNEGAWIVLEMNPADYVLSQIVHLIEQNNAKVWHVFSYMEEETSRQTVLLRIDLEDASPVVRSLERFNYTVIYHSQKQRFTLADETMRNRLDELMYYLEL